MGLVIKDFKKEDWTKIWAGGWSFLTCSHFGDQYTKEIIFGDKPFLSQAMIFVKAGKSAGWARQADRDIVGIFLAEQVIKDPNLVEVVCSTLKKEVDLTLAYMDKCEKRIEDVDAAAYEEFWKRILVYYKPHINIKYVVDYLEPKLLEKYLPHFEEARIYAEPVFKRSEDFMQKVAAQISKKIGYAPELILCFTKAEILKYFTDGSFPGKNMLEERNANAVQLFDLHSSEVLAGDEVLGAEKIVNREVVNDIIKGAIAFKGKVSGPVKIILDPNNASHFKEGDILVTGMTRPEYLPIMEKAAGFITDAGGILSHAAITAREMKKPCVIGTQIATKALKDGDVVEIDADKGIVKILKKN